MKIRNILVILLLLSVLVVSCKKRNITGPTPANSRLSSVTEDDNGAPIGVENYYYNSSGVLLMHTVKDASNHETKRYVYAYDVQNKLSSMSYYEAGSLSVTAEFTYVSGTIDTSTSLNSSGAQFFLAQFFYGLSGYITEKDLYAYTPGPTPANYFYYTTNPAGLVTQEIIESAAKTVISSTTQAYNAAGVMTYKNEYDAGNNLTGSTTFAINSSGLKTDLYYSVVARPGDIWHGVYAYEYGTANFNENMSDYYENICLNISTY